MLLKIILDGLKQIYRYEGIQGLYRGTWLALVGVSNGALQFMGYEEMKRWAFRRKKRQYIKANRQWNPDIERLVGQVTFNKYITYASASSLTQLIPSCRGFQKSAH